MVTPAANGAEKILLVRVGRGGDLIMITPALDALLTAYPSAEFHLLTTGEGRRILNRYDDRITKTYLYTRRFPRTLLVQRDLLKQFRAEGYTRVYIFETKPHYQQWLGEVAPDVFALQDSAETEHFCDKCFKLVAATMDNPPTRGWARLTASASGQQKARALLTETGVDPAAKLVGLHPTFSGTRMPFFRDRHGNKHRMWPGASFASLARILTKQAEATGQKIALVIDALPEEEKFIRPIIEQSDGTITLLTKAPDFQRYKGFLSLLDVLVTPNTGPMHMAAALNTPLVALFSDWDPADCGPFMDPARYRVLRAEDTDQPDRGLAAISPEQVADVVLSLLPHKE